MYALDTEEFAIITQEKMGSPIVFKPSEINQDESLFTEVFKIQGTPRQDTFALKTRFQTILMVRQNGNGNKL